MRKEGESPTDVALSRTSSAQKLSIVHIFADGKSKSCDEILLLFWSFAAASQSDEDIRERSSAAAARVNVTTSILDMSAGFSSLVSERMILSVSVAVFPEPAAAETSRVLSVVSIASDCSFVHECGMLCSFRLLFFVFLLFL
jgi:hypothetical protein